MLENLKLNIRNQKKKLYPIKRIYEGFLYFFMNFIKIVIFKLHHKCWEKIKFKSLLLNYTGRIKRTYEAMLYCFIISCAIMISLSANKLLKFLHTQMLKKFKIKYLKAEKSRAIRRKEYEGIWRLSICFPSFHNDCVF